MSSQDPRFSGMADRGLSGLSKTTETSISRFTKLPTENRLLQSKSSLASLRRQDLLSNLSIDLSQKIKLSNHLNNDATKLKDLVLHSSVLSGTSLQR